MQNTSIHYKRANSISLVISTLSAFLLIITACSAPVKVLKSGETCPVTLSESATIIEGVGQIAGKYPIMLYLPENGFLWKELGPISLPPYEGRINKQTWAISDNIQGKVRISGTQLDGNGIVLFPNSDSAEWASGTTIKWTEKPKNKLIIDTSSSNGRVTSPKPKDYTYFGDTLIYPHPGCYQFTASIGKYSVDIVVEILDK